ncbi:hypothetical protein TWF481_000321 [Arthrobotrys musiformis]|uniref:F-box domain-containing protein n=1 Tax=Arthrobotrys musiformis TaxID=47236 RepID=A0AAV9WNU9_9PEZI
MDQIGTQSQPQPESPPNALNALPTEIHLGILEKLPGQDLKALALCSKYYNDISRRFLFRHVQNNGLKLFQGGSCEGIRHHVQSVKLVFKNNETHSSQYEPQEDFDRTAYSKLRVNLATLKLFPCVRSLHVFLKSIRSVEKAIYLTILKAIGNSEFRNTLEDLRFEIERDNDATPTQQLSQDQRYKYIYSNIATVDQEFIGNTLPSEYKLETFTNATPNLPALKRFRLCGFDFPSPIDDPRSNNFRKHGFYYHSIALAPRLRDLHVDIPWGFEDIFNKESLDLHPDLVSAFSRIQSLTLRLIQIPGRSNIQRLPEIFPNLENLDIRPHFNSTLGVRSDTSSSYDAITNLKSVRAITLPWPILKMTNRADGGILTELACSWKRGGLHRLETVVFVDRLYVLGQCADVKASIRLEGPAGGTVTGILQISDEPSGPDMS